MNCRNYFQLALVFPILATLLFLGPNWTTALHEDEFGTHAGLPLYLAVIPYCGFVAAFIGWTWKKTERSFMRAMWLAPLMSTPFVAASWTILNYDSHEAIRRNSTPFDLSLVAVETLIIGYLYVATAIAIGKLLASLRLIKVE